MDIRIIEQNPWWQDRRAIEQDKDIIEYKNTKFKLPIPELRTYAGIVVIRGPRQVGKTTLLKHLVMDTLNQLDPRQLFYFNLESGYPLEKAIREFLDFADDKDKRVLLIDEATEDNKWTTTLKYFIDSGKITKDDLIVVTGSSSIDLKAGADRLPGRNVEGNEYLFYPYSFRDFFAAEKIQNNLINFDEKIARKLALDVQANAVFSKYITNGGLPSVWNMNRELAKERYARWIEGVIAKNNKSVTYAKELFAKLAEKTTFDFIGLARETSISSHHTVESFLTFFEAAMLGKLLYNYNLATNSPDPKKEKKFVFLDPFLVEVLGQKRQEPRIVEDIVGSHLLRISDEMYFYRDKRGEIDFLCKISNKLIPVEVKWQDKVDEKDAKNLKKFGGGFIVTKNTFEKFGNILAVPAPVFLRMIGNTFVKRKVL